jgi:SAM-dependent methyltransferase
MFFAGAALSGARHGEAGPRTRIGLLAERLDVPSGGRLLLSGASDHSILPCLRLRLGLTGQLVIADPSFERLASVPRRDADWAVLLKAAPSSLPNIDASFDCVLCWSTFLDLDRHYPLVAAEMFRVLAPGGRILIAEPGPGAPLGRPRPCPLGLSKLFIEAGFSRVATEESEDFFLFKAEKVAGFDLPLSRTGWA